MSTESSGNHPDIAEVGVLVIGGGVVGLSVAIFLAREGRDVAIIDADLPNGSTTNAGSLHVQVQGRYIRRNPQQAAALENSLHLYPKAIRFWHELERDLNANFDLKTTGGIMLAETQEHFEFLVAKTKREKKLGLDVEMLDEKALRRIAPYLEPGIIGAQHCASEGKINPLLANAALRAEAVRRGVRFLQNELVRRVTPTRGGWFAMSARGQIKAGSVVVAAGPWSRELAQPFGIALPSDARFLHMSITEELPPLVEHLVQHAELPMTLKQLDAGQVLIGGGWPAHYREDRRSVDVRLDSFVGSAALAGRLVPALRAARIIRSWAGATTTMDGQCVLGPTRAAPNLSFAIGGFAGYTLGPFIARLVADCVLGKNPSEDISPFSPDRFGAN